MKYFTLATLTLLTSNTFASNEVAKPEDSIINKAVNETSRFFKEVSYAVKNVFYPGKNLIKARLEVPQTLSPDSIVHIDPKDNYCVAANEKEYWKSLYATTDPKIHEKIIFCPNALVYLKNLDAAKLAASSTGGKLCSILSALMLRRSTLIGEYMDSYVNEKYLNCFNALWDKVQSDSSYWPCKDFKSCDASSIKDNFSRFTNETPACNDILKDQLTAYAEKVAEAATANKIESAVELRSAILENLNAAPHLSIPMFSFYDNVIELNKSAAAAKIQSVISDISGILRTQTNGASTVYHEAENNYLSRLLGATKKVEKDEHFIEDHNTETVKPVSISTEPIKPVTVKIETNHDSLSSIKKIKTDNSNDSVEPIKNYDDHSKISNGTPTKTVTEPTKTKS